MEWDVDETTQARESFSVALTKQFNSIYGTDVGSLEAWQSLCYRVGVPHIPDSVTECRKVCSALVNAETCLCATDHSPYPR